MEQEPEIIRLPDEMVDSVMKEMWRFPGVVEEFAGEDLEQRKLVRDALNLQIHQRKEDKKFNEWEQAAKTASTEHSPWVR